MKDYPFKNMNSVTFTIAGVIVGLLVEDGYSKSELNAIGNWLILVGQITLTTAAQMNLLDNNVNNHEPY